jgi:hypothetical protein
LGEGQELPGREVRGAQKDDAVLSQETPDN